MEAVRMKYLIQLSLMVLMLSYCLGITAQRCEKRQSFIPCGYDSMVRPNADSGPTDISLQMYVESFGEVDVEKMEIDAFGYLSQTWRDDRLAKVNDTPIILRGSAITQLWTPDIYCINCRSHNLENGINIKQSMMRIDVNGSVYLSAGVGLTGSCYMNLRNFPFDVQHCNFTLSSYSYNTSHVRYRWKKRPFVKVRKMDQFLISPAKGTLHSEEYMSGEFSIMVASFSFIRRYGYYLLQLYVPTVMLVGLSWTMFCLNQDHTGDRINIGVTLFLTMIFLLGYANSSLPKVSYVKFVDLFMIVSLAEILLITIESIVISRLYDRYAKIVERNAMIENNANDKNFENPGSHQRNCFHFLRRKKSKCEELDEAEMQSLTTMQITKENANEDASVVRRNGIGAGGKREQKKSKFVRVTEGWKAEMKLHVIVEKVSVVFIPLSYIVFIAWYWIVLSAHED